jgi:hypothetical protein
VTKGFRHDPLSPSNPVRSNLLLTEQRTNGRFWTFSVKEFYTQFDESPQRPQKEKELKGSATGMKGTLAKFSQDVPLFQLVIQTPAK